MPRDHPRSGRLAKFLTRTGLTFTPGVPTHTWNLGLEYGITFGLGAAVAGVLSRAWGRYVLASLWFAIRGYQPWQIMRFLDDAHRRGVLRQTGAVYEFRHVRGCYSTEHEA